VACAQRGGANEAPRCRCAPGTEVRPPSSHRPSLRLMAAGRYASRPPSLPLREGEIFVDTGHGAYAATFPSSSHRSREPTPATLLFNSEPIHATKPPILI